MDCKAQKQTLLAVHTQHDLTKRKPYFASNFHNVNLST